MAASTIQTIANKIAAVKVNPAKIGDKGYPLPVDGPRKKKFSYYSN